jgi:UDP-glucose 4-epimerase
MRIIITGAAGFIGSTLCQFFHRYPVFEFDVVGIDNMKYGAQLDNLKWCEHIVERWTFIEADVCDAQMFNIIKPDDIVIHCAAIAPLPTNQEQPYLSVCNNIGGTVNLLEACRRNGAKHFLFASTSAVYENNTTFPLHETDPILPPTLLYCSGKKYAEEVIESYYKLYNLPYTIFRFFNVYGPHHDCLRKNPPLIGYLVSEMLAGRRPLLHSNGTQARDYIYVDDVVALIDKCINNLDIARSKTYNICSNKTCSVRDIVQHVQTILGTQHIEPIYRDSKLIWEKNVALFEGHYPIKDEVIEHEVTKYSLGSYVSAQDDFGWIPITSLKDGLTRTILHAKSLLLSSSLTTQD